MDETSGKQSAAATEGMGEADPSRFSRLWQLFGSSKVWKVLTQQGVQISLGTVTRIMKELGLKSRTVRKYKATTNSKHNLPVVDNTLNQQFAPEKPNQVWAADITYIPMDEGWLYLASVEDLCTRKTMGFHMNERMTKALILKWIEGSVSY